MPTMTRNERVYGTDAMFVAGIRIGVDGRGSWDSAWGWDSVRATALPKRPVGTTALASTAGQPAPGRVQFGCPAVRHQERPTAGSRSQWSRA